MKTFFKKLYKKYCDSDSFLKITFLFESVLIISLVFVSVFATKTFSSILKEKEVALGENKMQALSDFMQEEYNRIYSLGNYIHSGGISEIITEISETETSAYEYSNISAMQAFFSGIGYSDENISDVILVSDRGNVYSYTRQDSLSVTPSYDFWEEEMVQKLLSSERNFIIFYDEPSRYCVKEREAVISFAGKIYDASLFPSKKVMGIYIMNIPVAQIEESLSFSDALQGEIFLTNEGNQILYSNNEKMWGETLKENKLQKENRSYNNRQSLGNSGINVTYQLSEKLLFYQIYKIRNRIMMVMVLAIVVTFLFSYVIYKVFRRKINVLLASMIELEKGNFDVELPVQAKDEIGRISMQFNEMCQKLNTYVQQVYRSEIQRKNAEINALQTQIDPHFLYNTLESIKAQALAADDTDTAVLQIQSSAGNQYKCTGRIFRLCSPKAYFAAYCGKCCEICVG